MTTASAYIDWKDWAHGFGQVDRRNAAYFANEMRAAKLPFRPNSVLEIGFGSGQFLGFCAQQGFAVTGLEMNDLLVAAACEHGFDARGADALFGLPAASFDLVAAFDVMEHINKADIPGFLTSIRDCLSDNGRVLLRFPNGDSWLGQVNQNGDPTHQTAIGYFMLDYFARAAGLEIISFEAPAEAGFAAGAVKGLHRLIARPIARLIAGILHLIYLPGSPVVLSSSNVVAVLAKADMSKQHP